jgi:hypothetical protein
VAGKSAPSPDKRGKHNNRPKRTDSQKVAEVKEHISSFPTETSHYSRHHNPNRQYLSSVLNISLMYRLYCEWCEQKQSNPVSEKMYRDIFNNHFNLGFGSPKSDTCATCDLRSDEGHKSRAEKAFEVQRNDKKMAETTDGTYFITFDLQKTLPLPKLSTSVAFYLRTLWLYNLGVHLTYKDHSQPFFHIWTEADGGRGCGEVASSILAFIDAANIPTGSHLIAWSDSCCGQNKNFFIVCLWQYLVKSGRFSVIDHKFPESGHSYMDSDRDFGHIEKKVRQMENIYSVDQYQDIMAQSQHKSKPHITRMQGNLYNIKSLPTGLGLMQRHTTTDGEPVKFRDNIRWIRVTEFGSYMFKESLEEGDPWKTVNLLQSKRTVPNDNVVSISQACLKKTGSIKHVKLQDIKKQLPYIPETYKQFYSQLACGDNCSTVSSSDESDEDGTVSTSDAAQPARKRLRLETLEPTSSIEQSHSSGNELNRDNELSRQRSMTLSRQRKTCRTTR